jgi:hypothetical protein
MKPALLARTANDRHWGIPDPAAVKGTPAEIARAFRDAFSILDRRIGCFFRCRCRR